MTAYKLEVGFFTVEVLLQELALLANEVNLAWVDRRRCRKGQEGRVDYAGHGEFLVRLWARSVSEAMVFSRPLGTRRCGSGFSLKAALYHNERRKGGKGEDGQAEDRVVEGDVADEQTGNSRNDRGDDRKGGMTRSTRERLKQPIQLGFLLELG